MTQSQFYILELTVNFRMKYLKKGMKVITLLLFSTTAFTQQPNSPLVSSFQTYRQMKEVTPFKLDWISVGPTVNSARADVVQGDEKNPGTMYVGFGSGGLWKTTNHGITWKSIFEEQSSVGIGDVELAPSNPNIIYLGTGENLKKPRNFTLPGTGMFRSDDAGATWRHIGLEDSWSIAEIEIHPTNPEIVFVCVLGHLWSKNKNRGLFRTTNGGKTWTQVLYKDDMTGANEIAIAPANPQVMYTSLWEMYPGISGKNSGIYRSVDGGSTWSLCTKGLPSGPKIGRIGLAVSAINSNKVYALMDNLNFPQGHSAELYKSVDGGVSWTKTHSEPLKIFTTIGWYFTDVYLNPKDDEEVFCLGIRLAHSTDGGKTFNFLGGQVTRMNPSLAQGLHLDQTELWINRTNPNHIAVGNDGGLYVSYDKGLNWMHYNNIPTGEFYDITIDQSEYTIYGGTQDDATVSGPPKELNTRFPDPWKYVWIDPWDGGDGCVTQVDPDDKNIIYYSRQHGDALRLDKSTDKAVSIMPVLPKEIKDTLLFNYMTPYFLSKYNSKTLYQGGNYLMKSVDRGETWQAISPNLTLSSVPEKKSFAAGTIAESPMVNGLLYVGTDHGAFWVSENDGKTWQEHSTGIAHNYIRSISPSRHKVARVYMAMTGINYDDLHSYVYVSEDDGKHWKNISMGLPDEPVNVIKEDPTNENIVYVGTIRGVFVSIDRGKTWSYLGVNMPATAVSDLEIHEATQDLIVGTHGRGIYKTNLKPIQQLVSQRFPINKNYLFDMEPAKRPWFNSNGGEPDYRTIEKTAFSFWLTETKSVTLSIHDSSGKELWATEIKGHKGLNQFRWDLIIRKQTSDYPYFVHYDQFIEAGTYVLRLSVGDERIEQKFSVVNGTSPYIGK
jgi:photosystem II stability/assembly factor-like uncharacterized protein